MAAGLLFGVVLVHVACNWVCKSENFVEKRVKQVCWLVSGSPVVVLEAVVAVGYVDCWWFVVLAV